MTMLPSITKATESLVPIQSLPQNASSLPARISAEALSIIEQNITALETFIQNSLIPDIDYGRVKGIPEPFLQDPGSQKIVNAFSCYFEPEILQYTIDPDKELITYIVRVKVIERGSGAVKAEGMGVASTLEQKYGKRWVRDPEDFGYDKEGLRTREGEYPDKAGEIPIFYQIPSPDWGDLVNTLLTMATKRAEMDAAKAMPGVLSALRILFMGETVPNWKNFWAKMRDLGFSSDQVHDALYAPSLKDWLAKGKTLAQAEAEVMRKLKPNVTKPSSAQKATTAPTEQKASSGPSQPPLGAQPRDPETIKTMGDLQKACYEDFHLQPKQLLPELGVNSWADLKDTPAEAYRKLAAVYGPQS